jgi:hypothetical protein
LILVSRVNTYDSLTNSVIVEESEIELKYVESITKSFINPFDSKITFVVIYGDYIDTAELIRIDDKDYKIINKIKELIFSTLICEEQVISE